MKGDFSRWTAPNARHRGYAGVLMQQGRLHTDADWNEQVALTAARAETGLGDIVGRSGAPKLGGGFRISPAVPPGGFAISPGRFYLDGVLLENAAATTYAEQAAPVEAEALAEILAEGEEGLIYLEAWKEHVPALDDPRLLEPALGGVDTATRVRIRWRVGVMASPFADAAAREAAIRAARKGEALDIPAWAPGTGGLRAGTAPAEEPEGDPDCLIPPEAGYLSQENQLYRIEIIRGGPRGQAWFVWSRENGAVLAALARNEDGAFILQGAREDEALGFRSGDWVEVFDAATRFHGEGGQLTRITLEQGVATFSPAIGAFEAMIAPRLRRWDHPPASPSTGLQLRTTPTTLERGIEVSFVNGTYRVGDYWVIPARAATGTIDWPPYPAADDAAIPPFGWGRRFAALALARRSGQGIAGVVDLRALFPLLGCIEAADTYFDDSVCGMGAETVQQALDLLCRRGRGKCTIFAHDAASLEAGVAGLEPLTGAHICLGAGQFQFQRTLRIAGLTHLTISGAGPQSLMSVGADEAALEIEGCASVRLEDFAANGGRVGSSGRRRGRLGAITIRDCADVAVERVHAACRAGPTRRASCIAVYGAGRPGPVRVRDCRLTVGQAQIGVQIVGAARALVENNRIRVAPAPADVVRRRLRTDGVLVSRIARGMVSLSEPPAATEEEPGAAAPRERPAAPRERRVLAARRTGAARPSLAIGEAARPVGVALPQGPNVTISAHPSVAPAVADFFRRSRNVAISDEPEARAYLINAAEEAVRTGGSVRVGGRVWNGFRDFVRRITEEPYFSEGVVIAGPRVEEALVLGNEIDGAQDGVRIAASASGDREPPNWMSSEPGNVVARASVARNRVRLRPPAPSLPGHGVFLGHLRVAEVSGNDVRGPEGEGGDTLWYGVRSYGWRGHLLAVTQNAAMDVAIGVSIMPDLEVSPNEDTRPAQWFASGNGAENVAMPLELAAGVVRWP